VKVEGAWSYPAPPARVWARLLDAEALRSCIPGCKSLDATGPDAWDATLSVGAGPIRGTYTGKVAIVEKDEPSGYTLRIEGKGAPGFVKGTARVTLTPEGDGTRVTVDADGQVGGTVAAVGQRMLGGVARQLMGQFFDCLKAGL